MNPSNRSCDLKEVDVDRLVGGGQRQLAAEVRPLRRQLVEQPMMRRHGEIAVNHQLVADQACSGRAA